jgi:hypothetical protein
VEVKKNYTYAFWVGVPLQCLGHRSEKKTHTDLKKRIAEVWRK